MSTRDSWLALGEEAPLEPELPVCDPHHHLWIYPENRYLVEEFLEDVAPGHRVVSTVHVECLMFYRKDGPPALRPVGETEEVDRLTAHTQQGPVRVAAGIVGMADLRLGNAVQPVLDAHRQASGRFRGVRFGTAWDPSDKVHGAHTRPAAGELLSTPVRDALGCVERSGLVFDAWMYFHQLPELVTIAQQFPGLRIVLDHVGGPIGIGPYAGRREEVFATWREHLGALAAQPNVLVKLGGLAMSMAGFGWHKRDKPPSSAELAQAMRPYFLHCIELFGPARCMFESNFPMDRVSCSYTVLWNAFKRVAADFRAEDRRALFHDTAIATYAL